jgi:pyruvate,orthophosphate dikinase
VNDRFLAVCTRWQLREVGGEQTPNDHTDPVHDGAVLVDLVELHRVVVDEVADPATSALERFASYRTRFDHALGRLRAGDLDWFTRPMIDSYHTVWFELHDDLLATLGLDRAAERAAARSDSAGQPMHATSRGRGQTGRVGGVAGPADEE